MKIELFQMASTFIAYIDPGTGSLLLQMAIASVVGIGVFFRRSVARVFGWFKPKKEPPEKNEPGAPV